MSRIHSVLCAVDFSAASKRAAGEAIRFAEQLGATSLVFLHAFEPRSRRTSDGPVEESLGAARSDADARLKSFLRELPQTSVATETRVVVGDPVDCILAGARAGADVLVVGTTGRTGLRRAMMGSVAEGVARRSPVPVIVVREPSEES